MREGIAGPHGASTAPTSEALEGLVRQKAQQFIQRILEEVTELLGQESRSEEWSMRRRATGTDTASRDEVAA
jgi:hypothetical protein